MIVLKMEKINMQTDDIQSDAKSRAVVWEDVHYFQDARGMLAKPKRKGNYPGVLLIHEFWGLNDYIKNTARELASHGYVVFAVDLFHGQVTADPERAARLVRNTDQAEATKNMRVAIGYLRAHEKAERIASLGWCFGGGQSLKLALSGEKLDGTIIYYGHLDIEEKKLAKIKWPVLGIFGEKDVTISIKDVKSFENALNTLHVENEIYIYPGVGHAFANPSNPNYAEKQTNDAWEKTLKFLNRNLKSSKRKVKIKVIE